MNELPPPMAAEASSGIRQRLTLDRSSFEKLLAAAWVLQCLHDQLHSPEIGRDQTHAEPLKTRELSGTGNLVSRAVAKAPAQFPPSLMKADSPRSVPSAPPAAGETLANLAEVQQSTETGSVDCDAAVEAELTTVELKKNFHGEDAAMLHTSALPLPVKQRVRRWPTFNLRTPNLRKYLNRIPDAVSSLRPVLRVNLTPRGARAAAIATPVLLLVVVIASLLHEAWHHGPLHGTQATATPGPVAPETAVREGTATVGTSTPGTSTEGASRHIRAIGSTRSRRLRPVPPLEVSHKRVTERATLSVVQGLSRYEIRGLRRQAQYGDASAAFTLGMAYEVGHNVPQNCAEAARWVTKAAEAGNAAAQYNLGLRYRDGDGVSASRAESRKWLRKASAHRSWRAELALKTLPPR